MMKMKNNLETCLLLLFCMAFQVEAFREYYAGAKISNENLENIPTTFNKSIEILEIDKCNIHSLENLSTYKQLKHLVIKDSDINLFNETFFEITKLRGLEYLSLEGSSIKVFDVSKLGRNLKHLDLSNIPGIEVKIRGSAGWSKISHLNLANNNLSHLPDGLKLLRHLEDIVLNGNPLSNNIDYFKIWPKLKNISIDKKVTVEHQDSKKVDFDMYKYIPEIFAALMIIILVTIIAIQFCKRKNTRLVNNSMESESFQINTLR